MAVMTMTMNSNMPWFTAGRPQMSGDGRSTAGETGRFRIVVEDLRDDRRRRGGWSDRHDGVDRAEGTAADLGSELDDLSGSGLREPVMARDGVAGDVPRRGRRPFG